MLKEKIGFVITQIVYSYKIYIKKDTLLTSYRRWVLDHGDQTHRLEYDLDEKSIIFDVGGFEGQWSADIYERYQPSIYIFEPLDHYIEIIKKRFKDNEKVHIYPVALGSADRDESMSILGDASSVFRESDEVVEIKFLDIISFIKRHNIKNIDLIKLNIEGGEYEVLERLIGDGYIGSIVNLQIQFHIVAKDSAKRMKNIQNSLAKTHAKTFDYPLVWEGWQLKKKN